MSGVAGDFHRPYEWLVPFLVKKAGGSVEGCCPLEGWGQAAGVGWDWLVFLNTRLSSFTVSQAGKARPQSMYR